MLGAMLDLKIREASRNEKSLDHVMRALYTKYYQRKKRGFTDAEFRAECESAAGVPLTEIFEYASTTKEVNYARYFALAGLKLDATSEEAPGGWIGLDTQNRELAPSEVPAGRGGRGRNTGPSYKMIVTDTAAGSPATRAGLKPGDRILAVDGAVATAPVLNDAINARKPGEKIVLRISRDGIEQDVPMDVMRNFKKTYRLSISETASPAETQTLQSWLRSAQQQSADSR
jgi:predicted metalloprotease with PDZ domain